MSEYIIKDESTDHNYFSLTPHIICFIGLNAFQISLYTAIKMVTGEKGNCTKSRKHLAEHAGMSESTLKRVLPTLAETNKILKKPLIIISERYTECGDQDTNCLNIVDIWPENMKYFSEKGGRVSQNRPQFTQNPPRFTQNPGVGSNRPGGRVSQTLKQEPFNKNPINKKTTTPTPFKGEAVVDVVFSNIKSSAKSLKEWIDKEASKKRLKRNISYEDYFQWGDKWIMPLSIYESLIVKYGMAYFSEQLNYMVRKQLEYDQGKGKKPIEYPETYLKLACSRDYADAGSNKK